MSIEGSRARRIERGDWQTPIELAREALDARSRRRPPACIVEPTCGEGAFLLAARETYPRARLVGFEVNSTYVKEARRLVRGATIRQADFFQTDWDETLRNLPRPLLVLGNPPWVTNAALGVVGGENAPTKRNWRGLSGLDALTGSSNFDVSEWMILRLCAALGTPGDALAMLCKTKVARRVIQTVSQTGEEFTGSLHRIDAQKHFHAQVDAVLFSATRRARPDRLRLWPVYESLRAPSPESSLAMIGGELVADAELHARTKHLEGRSSPEWRSGLKHDAAQVMELSCVEGAFTNGLGERVDIEEETLWPLLKSTDLARGRLTPARAVVLPQSHLGEDTSLLRERAPRAFSYLSRHAATLDARKSRIYEGRPRFSIFGVGPYSFAPWKVALSGLHREARFCLVGPHEGQPVLFDDTCYFLSFDDRAEATKAHAALSSQIVTDFLSARTFRDDKRPITKRVLQTLDWTRVALRG
jgi:methylase of polypeptide subunit release factors